jgi:transposase-like protein
MTCPHCGETELVKNGHDRRGAQVYRCRRCRGTRTALSATPFSGYRFPPAVIAVAVRLYLRYRLSLADVVALLAERHIHRDRSTVHAWVQRFAPLYQEVARARRRRVGSTWAVDETYIKVAGRPCYLYSGSGRARPGNSEHCDAACSTFRYTDKG